MIFQGWENLIEVGAEVFKRHKVIGGELHPAKDCSDETQSDTRVCQ